MPSVVLQISGRHLTRGSLVPKLDGLFPYCLSLQRSRLVAPNCLGMRYQTMLTTIDQYLDSINSTKRKDDQSHASHVERPSVDVQGGRLALIV